MRLPSWMAKLKMQAEESASVDARKLYEMSIIDGYSGSGPIRFRRTVLAISYEAALTLALEAWEPKPGEFESGISILVGMGWVQSGGYRNDQGQVALMERLHEPGKQSLVLTEFDGTVTTFYSDAKAWIYLQDHHYQPVR